MIRGPCRVAQNQVVKYRVQMTCLDDKVKQVILEVIFKHVSSREWDVFLFGSFARGTAGPGSDIDLALRGTTKLLPATAARILADLDDKVPLLRDFDLVDLNHTPVQLRTKVAQEGIPWHRATRKS